MANSREEFIAKFHALHGPMEGRKRDVFKLLKESRLSPNDTLEVVKLIQPKNYSETVLYADVAIYFKHVEPLMDMLMTGNEIYVSKILKQCELVKQIFQNVTSEQLIDEILCNLSYSIKMKVLRKLLQCKTAEQIDDIFEKVTDRYGFHYARILLRGCTVKKIKNILQNFTVVCDSNELITFHKKDHSLVALYFIESEKRNNIKCENHFLTYLADKDPLMLWELLIKHKVTNRFKLGRRNTKKLLPTKEEEILDDANTYLKYFNQERVVRILYKQKQLPTFYKSLFPDDPADIITKDILISILKYCPKRIRYDLFIKCFEEVFQEDIWTNEQHIPDYILDYIPDKYIREKWGRVRYMRTGDCVYWRYYDKSVAIPILKEKINITFNQRKRAEILEVMAHICAVNRDVNLLEEVLEYFCERHANDSQWARSNFVNKILGSFKTEEFTEKIWNDVDKILTIMSMNRELYLGPFVEHIVKHILHLYSIDKDKNAQELILKHIPKSVDIYYLSTTDDMENPEQEKKFFTFILNSFDKIFSKDKDVERYNTDKVMIIHRILSYNNRHPKDKILLGESDKEFFINALKSGTVREFEPFRKDLMKTDKDEFEEELFDLFCRYTLRCDMYKFNEFVIWNLKKNSEKFLPHINILVKSWLTLHINYILHFWGEFRRYVLYFGLEQSVKEQVLHHLAENTDVDERKKCVVVLSYILPTAEFISIMDKNGFIPTIPKAVTDNAASVELFTIQKCFVDSLKNLREGPPSYLPLLLENCIRGDFLQPSIRILNRAFYYLPENKLQTYVDILQKKKSLSLQKHAFFLAVNHCNKSVAIKTLKSVEMVNNESIKKAVTICSIKYFSKSPTQEMLDIVLSNLKLLTEKDEEALNLLISIDPIDSNYKSYYLEFVWHMLERLSSNIKVKDIQNTFLMSMSAAVIQKLPLGSCKEFIERQYLQIGKYKGFLAGINNFVVNFLIAYPTEESFEFVFKLISNYKRQYWAHCKPSERLEVLKIFNLFYNKALEQDDFDISVFKKFLLYWSSAFSPIDSFSIFVKGTVLMLWKESTNLQNFADKMISYLNEINTNYGSDFVKVTKVILLFNLNMEEFLLNVLMKSSQPLVVVWVIQVLKSKGDFIVEDKIRRKYLGIDELLKKRAEENDNIKLHYNDLFEKF